MPNYGVNIDSLLSIDTPHVQVPNIENPLSDTAYSELQNLVDPLSDADGKELYHQAVQFVGRCMLPS